MRPILRSAALASSVLSLGLLLAGCDAASTGPAPAPDVKEGGMEPAKKNAMEPEVKPGDTAKPAAEPEKPAGEPKVDTPAPADTKPAETPK